MRHPGILHSTEELGFVKEQISAGKQPGKNAFVRMQSSTLASLSYTPKPFQIVECGSYNNPNQGCNEFNDDAASAYTHSLIWALTGKQEHADKARSIITS